MGTEKKEKNLVLKASEPVDYEEEIWLWSPNDSRECSRRVKTFNKNHKEI